MWAEPIISLDVKATRRTSNVSGLSSNSEAWTLCQLTLWLQTPFAHHRSNLTSLFNKIVQRINNNVQRTVNNEILISCYALLQSVFLNKHVEKGLHWSRSAVLQWKKKVCLTMLGQHKVLGGHRQTHRSHLSQQWCSVLILKDPLTLYILLVITQKGIKWPPKVDISVTDTGGWYQPPGGLM